jgi:protein-S-isoprenylcysteine O-methyltransferase Ste14
LVFYVTAVIWAVVELAQRALETARGTAGTAHDRGTRVVIALSLAATVGLSIVATRHARSFGIPGPHHALGAIVMWVGMGLRVWAIATLGRSFRTTVQVDPGQEVVSDGPYQWIRHPSYTGLIVTLVGFGLGLGNWLAVAICVLLPLPALLWRIQIEETELTRVLGDPYRVYAAETKRLVPGVW